MGRRAGYETGFLEYKGEIDESLAGVDISKRSGQVCTDYDHEQYRYCGHCGKLQVRVEHTTVCQKCRDEWDAKKPWLDEPRLAVVKVFDNQESTELLPSVQELLHIAHTKNQNCDARNDADTEIDPSGSER